MTQFFVLFYTTSWLYASHGADAPCNDLKFIHQMMDYRTAENEIAKAALQKILKTSLVFNSRVGRFCDVQQQPKCFVWNLEEMAKTLLQTTQPEVFRIGKPVFVHIDRSTKLFGLIGPESWFLFTALNISHDRLSLPYREWVTSGDCCCARDFVRTVKVVHHAAERGVKLNIDCAAIITDDVQQNTIYCKR